MFLEPEPPEKKQEPEPEPEPLGKKAAKKLASSSALLEDKKHKEHKHKKHKDIVLLFLFFR